MLPFFAYPLALAALVALPILTAIYLFRHRFRRRTVSSLMLWRFGSHSNEGGTKVQRIQLPLLFFLELLALLLLAVAASGPQWRQPLTGRPLVVVLDDSLSMRAVYQGTSAQLRARQFLDELLNNQPPSSTRLVLAGLQPHMAGPPVHSRAELLQLLDQWTCQSPAADLDASITLASEMGGHQANLLVLTDHPPADDRLTGDRLEWRAFGRPLDNLAIVNASRVAYSDQDRCLLEIANYSPKPNSARIHVHANSNSLQRATLQLAPNERHRMVFNIPSATPILHASLEPDALSDDNSVQLLPPIRRRVRVQLALTDSTTAALVSRTLDVTGLKAAITADPELVIHHGPATPAGSNAWNLRWLAETTDNPTAFTGPFVIDYSHPLTDGLALQGVVWAASTNFTASQDAVPLVMAGNLPLLLARQDALGRQQILLNLNLELSTIQHTPDWPILFHNLLQWRASEQPGIRESNARLGSEVKLATGNQSVTLTRPDGSTESFTPAADQLALNTPLPGLYSVTLGSLTQQFAANPLAAEESQLSAAATGRWGEWNDQTVQRLQVASAIWIFATAALALMIAHLALLARGRRAVT